MAINKRKDPFNKKYIEERCYWGLKPSKEVVNLLKYKKRGTVLDLGVGEGRNALFLAKKGFEVTGVDISKPGIKKCGDLAKKAKLNVRGIVADITTWKFDKTYDVIISTATVHFLSKQGISSLIVRIKENTHANGLNLITVFTVKDPGYKKNQQIYYFAKNDLKSFYKDWNVLKYKEGLTRPEKHGKNGKWHRHGIAAIIAKKR